MTRNLDIAKDAGDFFENHYSSGTFSGTSTGTHSGTSTGTHSGPSTGTHSGPISTSATFPTGHVIKTIYRNFGHYDNTAGSGVNSSTMTATSPTVCTDTNGAQNYYGTITGLTVGNDVMVTMHFHPYIYRASKICGVNFHIFKDGTSTSDIIYGGRQSDGAPRSLFQYTEGSVSEVSVAAPATLIHIDQNVQSTSATYYLGYDSDGTSLNFYANYGGYTCIMQEIQG